MSSSKVLKNPQINKSSVNYFPAHYAPPCTQTKFKSLALLGLIQEILNQGQNDVHFANMYLAVIV